MTTTPETISRIAAEVHVAHRQEFAWGPQQDPSRLRHCWTETVDFLAKIGDIANPLREMHVDPENFPAGNDWHFVIGYRKPGQAPSQTDLVTDLCPWWATDDPRAKGAFHGPRYELEDRLRFFGTPEAAVGLIGLHTLASSRPASEILADPTNYMLPRSEGNRADLQAFLAAAHSLEVQAAGYNIAA